MRINKKKLERLVFKRFVKNAGLNIIQIQSCKPPEPDILCENQFGKFYFELTDNTSEETQKAIHARDEIIKDKAYWFDPFPENYRQKFLKKYETSSIKCELIIYFGNHPVAELGTHFNYKLQENIEWIRQHILQSDFHKVWIYDYYQDKILAFINRST